MGNLMNLWRCSMCRTWFCPRLRLFVARCKSLLYLDTRMMTLLSGALMLAWAVGGLYEVYVGAWPIRGSVGKVGAYVPIWSLAAVLIPLGLISMYAAIVNDRSLRRVVNFLDVFWWSWLTSLMFWDPVNVPAGITYGVICLFRVWSFAVLNVFTATRAHDDR